MPSPSLSAESTAGVDRASRRLFATTTSSASLPSPAKTDLFGKGGNAVAVRDGLGTLRRRYMGEWFGEGTDC